MTDFSLVFTGTFDKRVDIGCNVNAELIARIHMEQSLKPSML